MFRRYTLRGREELIGALKPLLSVQDVTVRAPYARVLLEIDLPTKSPPREPLERSRHFRPVHGRREGRLNLWNEHEVAHRAREGGRNDPWIFARGGPWNQNPRIARRFRGLRDL